MICQSVLVLSRALMIFRLLKLNIQEGRWNIFTTVKSLLNSPDNVSRSHFRGPSPDVCVLCPATYRRSLIYPFTSLQMVLCQSVLSRNERKENKINRLIARWVYWPPWELSPAFSQVIIFCHLTIGPLLYGWKIVKCTKRKKQRGFLFAWMFLKKITFYWIHNHRGKNFQ